MEMKRWTEAEQDLLADKWGVWSKPAIAQKLGRSINAITVRAQRLGLGGHLDAGEYVTMHQLMMALGYTNGGDGYKTKSWIQNRDFPVHMMRVDKCEFRVVYLDEFWAWAEKHRGFIDLSRMEPLALGKEPAWVDEQRRRDYRSGVLQRTDPWTPADDRELIRLLKMQRYGYAELSVMIKRSAGAIQRRCCDLGTAYRPVKAENHNLWTDGDYEILADGIRNGDSYGLISKTLGRSEKAIRGKVYYVYFTENIDNVRQMIGSGSWGSGAPAPRVKQALSISTYRRDTQALLSELAGLLKQRLV